MISFKSFVEAIHNAIMDASDSLMDKNEGLLDKYFEERIFEEVVPGSAIKVSKPSLVPRMINIEYPNYTPDEEVKTTLVQVPLITLVPISASQIEKATLVADFEMEIVDDVLQLHFKDSNKASNGGFFKKSKTNRAKLEIVITPRETTDGLKLIIEGYETALKRQIH